MDRFEAEAVRERIGPGRGLVFGAVISLLTLAVWAVLIYFVLTRI